MANLVGSRIGRYDVQALLGRGGMAEVYRATDPNLGRDVAVKVMLSALADEDAFERRFSTEARAVAQLHHPNIVQVFDYGIGDAGPYMVMEFVPGGTLRDRLRSANAPMPFAEVVRTARAIGLALDDAHRKGIVHRDVKPANIMYRADGTPVLADFGIARVLDTTHITATSALTGTPAYMAPEQALGEPVPQSDLYALGVVAFEMLTGRTPFTASSATEMALKHMQMAPPSPASLRPDLPPGVADVLGRALAKDPNARPESGEALAAALERALNLVAAPPDTASPAAPAPQAAPPPERAAAPRAGAWVVVLAALTGRKVEQPEVHGGLGRAVSVAGLISLVMAALQFVLASVTTLSTTLALVGRYVSVITIAALVLAGLVAIRVAVAAPVYRRRALAVLAGVVLIGGAWGAARVIEQSRPARGPIVVVADFKTCAGCPSLALDDAIVSELIRYSDSLSVPAEIRRSRAIDRAVVEDTRAARQLGAEERAVLVIWGLYEPAGARVQYEVLGDAAAGPPSAGLDELRSFGYRMEAAASRPEHVAFAALGIVRYLQQDYAGAFSLFDRSVTSLPAGAPDSRAGYLYFFRANTRLRTGQAVADALADFERARSAAPGVPEIHQNLSIAYAASCKPDGSTSLDLALAENDQVIRGGRNDAAVFESRGSILFLMDRLDEAVEAYEEALARGGASEQAKADLASAYQRLGRADDAARITQRIAPTPAVTGMIPLSRTIAQADDAWYAGRYTDAAALYASAAEQAREISRTAELLARLYRDAGWAEFSAGRWQSATVWLEQSLAAEPRHFGVRSSNLEATYTLLANSYLGLKQFDKAVATFNRALKTKPCEAFALNGLARAYSSQGDGAAALATLKRLAMAEPGTGLAEIQMAAVMAETAAPAEAIAATLQTGYDKVKAWAKREPGNASAQAALREVEAFLKK